MLKNAKAKNEPLNFDELPTAGERCNVRANGAAAGYRAYKTNFYTPFEVHECSSLHLVFKVRNAWGFIGNKQLVSVAKSGYFCALLNSTEPVYVTTGLICLVYMNTDVRFMNFHFRSSLSLHRMFMRVGRERVYRRILRLGTGRPGGEIFGHWASMPKGGWFMSEVCQNGARGA
jgi:hypothetical protein